MNNDALRRMIQDELAFDPSLDATRITVIVADGIATLTGCVGSYAEKLAAERAALRIKGIRGVAQGIHVVSRTRSDTADNNIARRVLNLVDWNTAIPSGHVRVKVEDGYVVLTGDVEWQFQKMAAERAVGTLPGVKAIRNEIHVRPSVNPADIKRRIEEALTRYGDIDSDAIRIDVAGSHVTFEGRIHAFADRRAAEWAAWSVPGVISVTDRLVVA